MFKYNKEDKTWEEVQTKNGYCLKIFYESSTLKDINNLRHIEPRVMFIDYKELLEYIKNYVVKDRIIIIEPIQYIG